MQKESTHKSFLSGCEMKGPSEPAAHIVPIEGQLNMDSFVGNVHTVSEPRRCLVGDKYNHVCLVRKSQLKDIRLLCTHDHTLRKSINPFIYTHFLLLGSKTILYNNTALSLLPCLCPYPYWLLCLHHFPSLSLSLSSHIIWTCGQIFRGGHNHTQT